MIILGIDPGVATIGFGVIRAERGKHPAAVRRDHHAAGDPLSSRLLQIDRDMEELIHTFQPDEMAVEELFSPKYHHRHRRGPWPWRHPAGGGAAGGAHLRVHPHAGEAGGGGLWRADKRQVMLMTQRLLNMKQIPGRTTPLTLWPSLSATGGRPPAC